MNKQDFKANLDEIKDRLDKLCTEADKSMVLISLKTQTTQASFRFGYNFVAGLLEALQNPETADNRKAFTVGILAAIKDMTESEDSEDEKALLSPEVGHA